MEEAQPSMTYGELLRNANFRTIWFGQITSLLNILDRVADFTAIIRWTAILSILPMLLWALWHRRGQFTGPPTQEI
jgi:hypothetical protein